MDAVKLDLKLKLNSENSRSDAIVRKYYKLQKQAIDQARKEGPFMSPDENIRLKFAKGLIEVARKIKYYKIKPTDELKDIEPSGAFSR